MKLLLDTCTFLWVATDAPELSPRARNLFQDPDNVLYLSAVSVWEIVVKYAIGNLPLPDPPERFIPQIREQLAIQPLALDEQATLYLPRLPALHRDPFDRMLICQAIHEGATLLTPDRLILQYPVQTAW